MADTIATQTASLIDDFVARFGAMSERSVHVVRSPGRVNLIGEHTDYNDGLVFPMAIEPHVLVACRGRDDGLVRLCSSAYPEQIVEFDVNAAITPGEPAWANYVRGVAAGLIDAGVPLVGCELLLHNTLPLGGGLSSSAAVEIGSGLAFITCAGETIDRERLATIGQLAEHNFANTPCGIMDQMIVATGRRDHAMLLDCRDLSTRHVPLDGNEVKVVIANSMVRHELSGGEYAERRSQCEQGVAHFRTIDANVTALRDVTPEQVVAAEAQLDPVVFRRCRHVVGEIERCTRAAEKLEAHDYAEFGRLMIESHASLRDDYEVSTPELDALVEIATSVKGCYGSRMTGGGFGGCTVSLVAPLAVDAFADALRSEYRKRVQLEPDVIVTSATDGATVVQ